MLERTLAGPAPRGLVIASISFYPDITGTGQILTDLAEALCERGTEVHVYTAQPHYHKRQAKSISHEVYNGIRIHRIPSTTLNKNFRLGRILNWFSFSFSAMMSLLADRTKYPVLLVSSPPMLPFVGWVLKQVRKRRFVYLVQDIYPEIGVRLGYFRENGPTVRLFNFLNRLTLRSADRIIVLSHGMADVISKKLGDGKAKISIIHDWPAEAIQPMKKKENLFLQMNPLANLFLVQYAGNLGMSHELEPLIEAARRLQSSPIGFVFVGEGGKKEKLMKLAADSKLKNVHFFPFQPRELLPDVLGASDLAVVTLERGAEGYGIPSKFYSILASGKPVLAILDEKSEIAYFVRKYECGFVVSNGGVDSVTQVLQKCLTSPDEMKKMGENARRCFEENFSRKESTEKYRLLLSEL